MLRFIRSAILIFLLISPARGAEPPTLLLPFENGTQHLCTQKRGQGSHAIGNRFTEHDLDFGFATTPQAVITAAAGGTAYVHYGNGLNACSRLCVQGPNDGMPCQERNECAGGECRSGNFGTHINVDHGPVGDGTADHYFTIYAHLASADVANGVDVSPGDRIGTSDSTGYSCGEHLHFGLHRGNPEHDAIASVSIAIPNLHVFDVADGSAKTVPGDSLACGAKSGRVYRAVSWRTSAIVFSANVGGNWEVLSIDSSTGTVRNLSDSPAFDWIGGSPWSQDAARLVFFSDRDPSGIYLMNSDGTDPALLAPTTPNSQPVWSPVGDALAYSLPSPPGGIEIVNADGTNTRRLAESGAAPQWSATDRIAFVTPTGDTGQSVITMMNPDGSGIQVVDADPSDPSDQNTSPVWSPDGEVLLFLHRCISAGGFGCPFQFYLIDRPGGGLRKIREFPESPPFSPPEVLAPAWSPDGTKIAFIMGPFDIYIMNADGSELRAVAPLPTSSGGDWEPAWSPDGTHLVFRSNRRSGIGGVDLFVVSTDGTGLTNLTSGAYVDVRWPSWR